MNSDPVLGKKEYEWIARVQWEQSGGMRMGWGAGRTVSKGSSRVHGLPVGNRIRDSKVNKRGNKNINNNNKPL